MQLRALLVLLFTGCKAWLHQLHRPSRSLLSPLQAKAKSKGKAAEESVEYIDLAVLKEKWAKKQAGAAAPQPFDDSPAALMAMLNLEEDGEDDEDDEAGAGVDLLADDFSEEMLSAGPGKRTTLRALVQRRKVSPVSGGTTASKPSAKAPRSAVPAQAQAQTPVQALPNSTLIGRSVGIDLGTTYSSVAVMEGGQPVIIPVQGSRIVRSVVSFSPLPSGNKGASARGAAPSAETAAGAYGADYGAVLVGEAARRQMVLNPSNTFASIKRVIGRTHRQVEVQSAQGGTATASSGVTTAGGGGMGGGGGGGMGSKATKALRGRQQDALRLLKLAPADGSSSSSSSSGEEGEQGEEGEAEGGARGGRRGGGKRSTSRRGKAGGFGDSLARVWSPALQRSLSPQEVSAQVLRQLLEAARTYLGGEPITRAVITVPAYFLPPQCAATEEAGRMAGLEKVKLLREPEAAALAYGLTVQQGRRVVLVFDLGGGTFDVSVLEVGGGFVEVIATSGDAHLGGDDVDAAVVEWIVSTIEGESRAALREAGGAGGAGAGGTGAGAGGSVVAGGVGSVGGASSSTSMSAGSLSPDQLRSLRTDPFIQSRLVEAAERAKISLSTEKECAVVLPLLVGGYGFRGVLTQRRLEALVKPLLQRLLTPLREVAIMSGTNLQGESGMMGIDESEGGGDEGGGMGGGMGGMGSVGSVGGVGGMGGIVGVGGIGVMGGGAEEGGEMSAGALRRLQLSGRTEAKKRKKMRGSTDRELRRLQRELGDPSLSSFPGGQQLDAVVLVGGSTRMPCIQRLVRTVTGVAPSMQAVNPDEAVSLGAAVMAGILDGTVTDMSVHSAWQAAMYRAFYLEQQQQGGAGAGAARRGKDDDEDDDDDEDEDDEDDEDEEEEDEDVDDDDDEEIKGGASVRMRAGAIANTGVKARAGASAAVRVSVSASRPPPKRRAGLSEREKRLAMDEDHDDEEDEEDEDDDEEDDEDEDEELAGLMDHDDWVLLSMRMREG